MIILEILYRIFHILFNGVVEDDQTICSMLMKIRQKRLY